MAWFLVSGYPEADESITFNFILDTDTQSFRLKSVFYLKHSIWLLKINAERVKIQPKLEKKEAPGKVWSAGQVACTARLGPYLG